MRPLNSVGVRTGHWQWLDVLNLLHNPAEYAESHSLLAQNLPLYVLWAPCNIQSSGLLLEASTEMIF